MSINEEDFNVIIPAVESKASLWAKIQLDPEFDKYVSWMTEIDIPIGTIPSTGSHQYCYNQLLRIHEKESTECHPVQKIEHWLDEGDVSISPTEVIAGGVPRKVAMTFPGSTMIEVKAAIASNIIAYMTVGSDKGVEPTKFPEVTKVPAVNFSHLRVNILKCTETNATDTIEYVYGKLREKERLCDLTLNHLGQLPNFKESATVSARFGKPMKVIYRSSPVLPKSSDFKNAYRFKQASEGARGVGAGIGNISAGYTVVAMTRREHSISSMIRDIRNFMNATGYKKLKIEGVLDSEVIKSLALEFAVGYGDCMSSIVYTNQLVGEYLQVGKGAITLVIANNKQTEPVISSLGVTYNDNAEKAFYRRMELHKPCFAFVPITPNIPAEYGLFPIGAADNYYVIATTQRLSFKYPVSEFLKRGSMAVSCRNMYPIFYQPFCQVDFMKEYNWTDPITLCSRKITSKKIKSAIVVESDGKFAIADELENELSEMALSEFPPLQLDKLTKFKDGRSKNFYCNEVLSAILGRACKTKTINAERHVEDKLKILSTMMGMNGAGHQALCDYLGNYKEANRELFAKIFNQNMKVEKKVDPPVVPVEKPVTPPVSNARPAATPVVPPTPPVTNVPPPITIPQGNVDVEISDADFDE